MVVSLWRPLFLGFLLLAPAAAASPAEDLVAKAGKAYGAMNTFRAEGTIELTSQRGTQEGTFKIVGQGPTLTREEMTGISNYVTIGTETERWLYLPDRNQYHHLELGPTSEPTSYTVDVRKFAGFADRAAEATDLDVETIVVARGDAKEERACRKVGLPPAVLGARAEQAKIGDYTIWIDPASARIVREVIEMAPQGPAGQPLPRMTMTVTYSVMEIDVPVDDASFHFSVPDGATQITPQAPQEPPSPFVGQPAKDFTLTTLSGEKVTLASLRGRVVLLDFWATWCGPCKIELPHIQRLHEELEKKGLTILAISSEQETQVRRFMERAGYTIPTSVDGGAAVTRSYGVTAYPTVFVIDKEGVIRSHFIGLRTEDVLRAAIKSAGL